MTKPTWVNREEASIHLSVDERTLIKWCEVGYLKLGTHWQFIENNGYRQEYFHIDWCKEEMNYWLDRDARIMDLAA